MNQTQQDRAKAADALIRARKYRRKFETPLHTMGKARDRLREQAGRHLMSYVSHQDPYGNALACAEHSARAANLLDERYCRIYLDRDNY